MTPTLSRIAVGLMLFIGMAGSTVANNVQVTNVELIGQNTTAGADHPANFTMIQFDVDWENSWRASVPSSWDAAWVFAKFRVGSADYLSAPGATNSGTTVTVQSTEGLRTGMPVFVHSGSGSFAAGTVITGITSTTTFTISATLTGNLGGSAVVRAERIWEHCWLHQSGHVKGSMGNSGSLQVGLQDESAAFHASNNPALGVYIYRAADGSGAFSTAGARLRWNYGAQGIKDKDLVELKVFAVEMVYVPQGSFQVDTALYQSNTVLLLDGDGSNGQKNKPIIDASGNNHTITVNNSMLVATTIL